MLPPWAVYALASANVADVSGGIACEGSPNFVFLAIVGVGLMVDTLAIAATEILADVGVINFRYEGLFHYAGDGYGGTAADIAHGLGHNVDTALWEETGGFMGDLVGFGTKQLVNPIGTVFGTAVTETHTVMAMSSINDALKIGNVALKEAVLLNKVAPPAEGASGGGKTAGLVLGGGLVIGGAAYVIYKAACSD